MSILVIRIITIAHNIFITRLLLIVKQETTLMPLFLRS